MWPLGALARNAVDCSAVPVPASIATSLTNPNPDMGERIYLEDFSFVALDTDGNVIPEIPISIVVLAQEGMLLTDPQWDYVEIQSFGFASFMIQASCPGVAGTDGIVSIQVSP